MHMHAYILTPFFPLLQQTAARVPAHRLDCDIGQGIFTCAPISCPHIFQFHAIPLPCRQLRVPARPPPPQHSSISRMPHISFMEILVHAVQAAARVPAHRPGLAGHPLPEAAQRWVACDAESHPIVLDFTLLRCNSWVTLHQKRLHGGCGSAAQPRSGQGAGGARAARWH